MNWYMVGYGRVWYGHQGARTDGSIARLAASRGWKRLAISHSAAAQMAEDVIMRSVSVHHCSNVEVFLPRLSLSLSL